MILYASSKSALRCSLSAFPKLRLYLCAISLNSPACFFSRFISFTELWAAILLSRVSAISRSDTLAGLPTRSTFSPSSDSFSLSRSTAVLLGAVTSMRFSPCAMSARMACTSVVVLPVPGGPCTMASSLACSILFTACCCVLFSLGLLYTGTSPLNVGALAPVSIFISLPSSFFSLSVAASFSALSISS